MARPFIAIVGHGPDLEREDGATSVLRGLGGEVRTLDLWDEPPRLFAAGDDPVRAIVVEAGERPDLAVAALRALRREPRLAGAPAIVAVTATQAARIEPSSGFEDFVLTPYVPAELYARIRLLEWRRSEFATEERMKVGSIVIDRSAHDVTVAGHPVSLTAKEFALLAYLAERRGKVVSREELLARVWGDRYEGGARTVDIHVRRLRAKVGAALPLATLRGAGYKLQTPSAFETSGGDDEEDGDGGALSAPSLEPRREPDSRSLEPMRGPDSRSLEPRREPHSRSLEPRREPDSRSLEPRREPHSRSLEPGREPHSQSLEPRRAPQALSLERRIAR